MSKKITIGLVVFLVVIGVGVCFVLAKQKIDKNNELRARNFMPREEFRGQEKQAPKPSFQEPRREQEEPVSDSEILSDEEATESIKEMEALMSESEAELESIE